MSFYLEDDQDDFYQHDPNAATTQICPNCSGTSFYDDPISGLPTCSSCFTQSQIATQEELEYDEGVGLIAKGGKRMYISGRNVQTGEKKRGGRQPRDLMEYDMSKKLPDVESCCLAFQWLLRDASKKCGESLIRIWELGSIGGGIGNIDVDEASADGDVDKEDGGLHSRLDLTVEKIWFAYLNSWMKATSYYSKKYPEMRASFRDYFVDISRKRIINQHLSVKLGKQIEEELIEKYMNELREKKRKSDALNNDEVEQGLETNEGVADKPEATKKSSGASSWKKIVNGNQLPKTAYKRYKTINKRHPVIGITHLNRRIFSKKTYKFLNGTYDMKPREAVLRINPSLTLILAILQLALNHLKTGIAPHHLTAWVANGLLPHALNGYALLPSDLKNRVVMAKKFFARSFVPPANIVADEANMLAVACEWYKSSQGEEKNDVKDGSLDDPHKGRESRHDKSLYNVPLLAFRMVKDFGMDQEVLDKVMSLMGVNRDNELHASENDSDNIKKSNGSKSIPDLKIAHYESLFTPLHIAAVIVVACKLCPGWETWKITRRFPDEMNDSNTRKTHPKVVPFIPWNVPQLQLLGNGPSLEQYLKFMEQIAFNKLVVPHDKLTNMLSSLPNDAFDSAIQYDAACATEKFKVTPNLVLAGEPIKKVPSTSTAGTQKLSRMEKYNSSYESHHYYLYGGRKILPTEPYSPHYCRLVEYICFVIEEPKPSRLHCLVEKIEDELFSIK
ncbi:hypothetical protein ACHAXS_004064 [Conticribra weissflogii]